MIVKSGQTDVSTYFVLRDSTTHAPITTPITGTDQAADTATAIDLYYCADGAAMASKVDAVSLGAANAAHADNKVFHVGQGLYRIDWPDAAFAGAVGTRVQLIVVCASVDTTYYEQELSPAVDTRHVGGTLQTAGDIIAAIGSIGSGTGAALNFAATTDNTGGAIKSVTFVGSQTLTYAVTAAEDGSRHAIADSGGTPDIDIVYQFEIGAGRNAAKVVWKGLVSAGDTVTVQAYNGSTWDTRATITATGVTNVTKDITLLATHTGTGADAGKVYIRFTCTGQTSVLLSTDELLVAGVSVGLTTGYADGAVWVKAAGTAGTTPYINGTADNPCPWANALTVAASVGLTRFRIVNGETVTLLAACTAKSLIGRNWTLALGAQDISGSYFEGATVTGAASGTTSAKFLDCSFGDGTNAAVTIPPMLALRCGVNCPTGYPLTAAAAGNGQYVFTDCYSLVAGSGTPYFDFSPVTAASGINFRRWSGGSNITLDSNCTLTMEVVTGGGQTIATGGALGVEIRGICRAVTLTGLVTSAVAQIDCVTGPISVNGTGGTVNIYGISSVVTDLSSAAVTINEYADLDEKTEAQAIRDALKLAPTAGTPAAGSVDKQIDDVQAYVNSLTINVDITVTGTLVPDASGDYAYGADTNSYPSWLTTLGGYYLHVAASGASSGYWIIEASGPYDSADHWKGPLAAQGPIGTYTAQGTVTGTATTAGRVLTEAIGVPAAVAAQTDIAQAIADAAILKRSLVLNSTTIATLASQTSFTLTAGSSDNDAYNGCIIMVRDASTATQRCYGFVSDYTGLTRTVTLAANPGVFTMAVGDLVDILPAATNATAFSGVFGAAVVGNVSASVTVTPLTSTIEDVPVTQSDFTVFQYDALYQTFTVVDSTGAAVNLASDTLQMDFFAVGSDVSLWHYHSGVGGNLTVGGTSNNIVTLDADDTHTQQATTYEYRLRNTATDRTRAWGNMDVQRAGKPAT